MNSTVWVRLITCSKLNLRWANIDLLENLPTLKKLLIAFLQRLITKKKHKAEEWMRVKRQKAYWYNGKNQNMHLGESSEITASVADSFWLAWHCQEFRLYISKFMKAGSSPKEYQWVFPYLGTTSSLKYYHQGLLFSWEKKKIWNVWGWHKDEKIGDLGGFIWWPVSQ